MALGSGKDWNQPYSCSEWASNYGLTFPLGNDEEASQGPWELFGIYQPTYVIIGHDMTLLYLEQGHNDAAIRAAIDSALARMERATGVETTTDQQPGWWNLGQAYPNPFNSRVAIEYTLPKRSEVTISIYTITGRKVTTLLSGTRTAGTHTVHWNGQSDSGSAVSSGMYLYRLQSGTKVLTRKITYIK